MVGRGRVDVHGQYFEPVCHIAGPVLGGHASSAVPESDDELPGKSAGGDRVGAEFRHMPSAVGRLARHTYPDGRVHRADPQSAVPERDQPTRDAATVSVDLRAAQQQVVRHVLGAGLVLHTDVRHAVLLLAHLQGGRAHDPGHQPGLPDDAQPPGVRQPVRRTAAHVAHTPGPRFVVETRATAAAVDRRHAGQR